MLSHAYGGWTTFCQPDRLNLRGLARWDSGSAVEHTGLCLTRMTWIHGVVAAFQVYDVSPTGIFGFILGPVIRYIKPT